MNPQMTIKTISFILGAIGLLLMTPRLIEVMTRKPLEQLDNNVIQFSRRLDDFKLPQKYNIISRYVGYFFIFSTIVVCIVYSVSIFVAFSHTRELFSDLINGGMNFSMIRYLWDYGWVSALLLELVTVLFFFVGCLLVFSTEKPITDNLSITLKGLTINIYRFLVMTIVVLFGGGFICMSFSFIPSTLPGKIIVATACIIVITWIPYYLFGQYYFRKSPVWLEREISKIKDRANNFSGLQLLNKTNKERFFFFLNSRFIYITAQFSLSLIIAIIIIFIYIFQWTIIFPLHVFFTRWAKVKSKDMFIVVGFFITLCSLALQTFFT